MLNFKTGNLLESDSQAIVHQANLFHTFGAGIAKAIKEKFPYAYDADKSTERGSRKKLGFYSVGIPTKGQQGPIVFNLYSQPTLYPSHTDYNNMFDGLKRIEKELSNYNPTATLGIPYQLGSGLADGNWNIVKAIIEEVFQDSSLTVTIYKLPETGE